MTQIREPAVAGHFYPANPAALGAAVNALLKQGQAQPASPPKALIVPHAGYVYSGPVAASAYAQLKPHRDRYRRVVLLGPCHRMAIRGLAVSDAAAFRTPLGDVPVDRDAIDALAHPAVQHEEAPHLFEHSLEVQLPFLQSVLAGFSLVPLAVGEVDADTVAAVLDLLWGGSDTLVVVSSDLSHYLPYESACRRDRATCTAIERMNAADICADDACGAAPVRGLLLAARRRGLQVRTLDLRNSGDTAGGRDQVVGYGAWALQEEPA